MSSIILTTETANPIRRAAAIRASRTHPGALAIFLYEPGQTTEIDLDTSPPALVVGPERTFAFDVDSRGRLVVSICEVAEDPPPPSGSSITRGFITWNFSREVTFGQYANGDFWVLGQVNIVSISPASTQQGARVRNGSMINPTARLGVRTGVDTLIGSPMVYDGSLNVGLGVTSSNPLVLRPGQTLCSTVSADALAPQQTQFMAALTCVAQAPRPGAFRPPYTGEGYNAATMHDTDLRWDLLRSLELGPNTPSCASLHAKILNPCWGETTPGWVATNAFAPGNTPTYGRDMSSLHSEVALCLHMAHSRSEKRDLLYAYIQRGIDLYGVLVSGGQENWLPNGGHASGRKWPILFAGLMLNDPAMVAAAADPGNAFGEDWQTWVVSRADVGRNGYTSEWVGRPEWGIRHRWQPQSDNPSDFAPYRDCCTANAWGGFVQAARLSGATAAWAWTALFDYYDRYMTQITRAYGGDLWKRDYSPNRWVSEVYDRDPLAQSAVEG